MIHHSIAEGTRVRLRAASDLLTFTCLTGRVVGPDIWDGYYVIRLDEPAQFRHGDGEPELLTEIREDIDNLEVIKE